MPGCTTIRAQALKRKIKFRPLPTSELLPSREESTQPLTFEDVIPSGARGPARGERQPDERISTAQQS